jgi:LysM repeat protein
VTALKKIYHIFNIARIYINSRFYREGRSMELIKENIEYEQLLGENFANAVVKNEYLIPDTHPDMAEILMVDVKPNIIGTEALQDKVYLEGQIEYNVLYLAKEEDKMGLYKVTYTDKFSNHVELKGAEHRMICEAECHMEHMDSTIINERKVALGGIVKLKAAIYKDYSFEIVKDVDNAANIQMLKSPSMVDKIAGSVTGDLIVKSHIQIPMDKPQIGSILKYDVNIHKKEIKLYDGLVQISAFALVEVLYRAKDGRDVVYLKDDVFVKQEIELEGIDPSMEFIDDFSVGAISIDLKEDDLGEDRIIDIESVLSANVKVVYKQEVDMINDVYSTQMIIDMVKKDYLLNVMQGQNNAEAIVKENIELDSDMPKPEAVIMGSGKVIVTDKKTVEDKVMIEAILKTDVLYKSSDEEKNIFSVSEEIPFSCSIDVPGTKIDMQSIVKVELESFDAVVEANTIAVKGIVTAHARVNYVTNKEFLVEIIPSEAEVPKKKASITIYVVQIGDTLWKIAKRYSTTIEELVNINNIENAENIKAGQKILIPGRAII